MVDRILGEGDHDFRTMIEPGLLPEINAPTETECSDSRVR